MLVQIRSLFLALMWKIQCVLASLNQQHCMESWHCHRELVMNGSTQLSGEGLSKIKLCNGACRFLSCSSSWQWQNGTRGIPTQPFSPVPFLVLKQKGSLIQPAPIFCVCELSWQNTAYSLTLGRVHGFLCLGWYYELFVLLWAAQPECFPPPPPLFVLPPQRQQASPLSSSPYLLTPPQISSSLGALLYVEQV